MDEPERNCFAGERFRSGSAQFLFGGVYPAQESVEGMRGGFGIGFLAGHEWPLHDVRDMLFSNQIREL